MANQVHGPEGMIFANKYRIVRLIGSGGMANVYLGIDMNTGVNVAIKILKPEFSSDEDFIRRFDAEAKSVASLNHANIVKVYGVGHEGNFRYIVQEYIEGITVKELINQNGHLDWRNAVPIVIQIGLALDYAHQNGIVHRDIKPQNILISRDRIAKITDFGIARAASSTTITMTGVQMGSVHYFSPEQARGGNVGPQSDIYSLGVSLFEMVTGRLPFDGDSNVAIAVKHLQETPPIPSSLMQGIPRGLDSIIAKCMQKSPERRYQTMRQLVTELDSLLVDPNGIYGVITNVPEKSTSTDTNISFRQDPEYEKISEIERSAESRRISRFRDNVLLALIIVVIVGVLIGIGILVVRAVGNATKIEQNTDYEVEVYTNITLKELLETNIKESIKIDTDELGTKEYEYETQDGEKGTVKVKVVDKTPPMTMLGDTYYHIQGTNFTILEDTVCTDNYDDNPKCEVICDADLSVEGVYDAKYKIEDSSGNTFEKDFKVQVVPKTKETKTEMSFEEVLERTKDHKLMIDVSKWEQNIDWKKVKESGIEYAFIRLGTEKYNTNEMILDPYFEKNYMEAKLNGIKVGVYFYTYAKTIEEVEIRANFVVDNLKGKEIDLGVAYDFECWEVYNSLNLSLHKMNAIKDRFMEIIEENGYRPILYSSKNYLEKMWDVNTDVWLAHYTKETNYAGDKIMWQFASNARIPGITVKTVDVSVYYE